MRGVDSKQEAMFSYVPLEARVPVMHSPRPIRAMISEALAQMDGRFAKLYSQMGRPSIAPERLIRALLLQVLYSIRSERLLEADIARELFETVVEQARMADLLSDEHFCVDGTMIAAWASHKSFRPKDGSGGSGGGGSRNDARDFRGERSNDSHASTTDPEAKLYKKSAGTPSKLAYLGHAVSENRNGLIVATQVTQASGTAERSAAIEMLGELSGPRRCTLAADKDHDTREFVQRTRELNVTPHVAQNIERRGGSAINARTTRHVGYSLSIKARKRIEESFGWAKDIGLLRRPKVRGRRKMEFATLLTLTGYNLVRMRNLPTPGFT